MAKTFKNSSSSDIVVTSKRASERDFFDLTDTPLKTKNSKEILVDGNTDNNSSHENISSLSNISNISATDNSRPQKESSTRIDDNSGNSHNICDISKLNNTSNIVLSKAADKIVAAVGGDSRQTFVLSRNHLEKLRDYVHARRAGGDYAYSQKQAMQEALDLLFASVASVAPRPDQAREREQQRRERIQQGRRARG